MKPLITCLFLLLNKLTCHRHGCDMDRGNSEVMEAVVVAVVVVAAAAAAKVVVVVAKWWLGGV